MRRWMIAFTAVILVTLILALVGGACAKPASEALSPADFYAQNTLTVVATTKAGGGTDLAARLFASYWPEYSPGGLAMVLDKPGGGGLVGANFVWDSKPDGLTIGVSAGVSHLTAPTIFQAEGMKFDIEKFSWIGWFGHDESNWFAVGPHIAADSMEELRGVEGFKIGALAPRAQQAMSGTVVIELFDFKNPKLVPGYKGSSELSLAVGKGEVDGLTFGTATLQDLIGKGLIKPPLLVLGYERDKAFPDVPAVPDLIDLTPEQKALFNVIQATIPGKPFYAPPGVPSDRLEYLRNGFAEIMANAAFVRQAKKYWADWREPVVGEDIIKMLRERVLVVTGEDVAKLEQLIDKYSK